LSTGIPDVELISGSFSPTLKYLLQKSQKTGKLITSFTAGPDHPLHPALKESEYLKSLFFVIN
jgi:23S rRNA G2069 N7-methylase RlmK/C1962 C5-methylase RlmI